MNYSYKELYERFKRSKTNTNSIWGILSPNGGIRTVSLPPYSSIQHHLTPGEKAYRVPRIYIPEPCPWDLIPFVIDMATWKIKMSQTLDNSKSRAIEYDVDYHDKVKSAAIAGSRS